MKPCIIALLTSALATASTLAQAEVVVILNASASASPSQSDVANIFLGKDTSLKGIDQKGWNPTKEKFYSAVTSKNESQLKSYWSGLVFTGKGQPLQSAADDTAVVALVGTEANAIGYVDKSAVTDKVKVLFSLP
ncbi:phosphate ABC transporter substrate-binding protein [Pseudomonas sp. JM0905a]|uniref:Phosphate ABC transporter substrate-binding protein n=1 Tax=Metapseudomonas resinovorans TaxID=53412 RepID=A0ABT4Y6Z3_METRE|nr:MULTISPECIES: phosphate ABC transporter substrate-binding protein [Pseudomonas]MBD2836466.1 phosphate ABC transporter substrate-binding protein [Pseudomonas sp. JM0905a]MDA8484639.1 phosphate ABC transporter substrate-binding protein [Pseudomonas resinovorans]